MTLLSTNALSIRIGDRYVCRHLDFQLRRGQYWGVLGGNGVGKTTLLHTLAGLRPAARGEIRIEGMELHAWNRKQLACKLGLLFQDSNDTFPASVVEVALAGRHPYLPFFAVEGKTELDLVLRALTDVTLETMALRQVDTLSGGERRRLALATLLVQNPLIWLLDEPANHLDLHHQINLLTLIRQRIAALDGAALMVLHDVNLVTRFCSHAMLMIDADNIVCGPVAQVINRENLERLYQHPIEHIRANGRDFFYPG